MRWNIGKWVVLAAVLMLQACQREEYLPEATSAAREVYLQYAGREDLTVALIGGYKSAGDTYNVVVMQAHSDEAWHKLIDEFGIKVLGEGVLEGGVVNQMLVTTMDRGVNWDGSSSNIDAIVDSVVKTIVPDGYRDMPMKAEVMAVEYDEVGQSAFSSIIDMMAVATADGKAGYVISVDNEETTLWQFFYSTQEELDRIFEKINNKQPIE